MNSDNVIALKIKVYPNPVKNYLHRSIPNNEDEISVISLYPLNGTLVHKQSSTNSKITISTNDIQEGLYILRIKTKNNTCYRKIVFE